MSVSQDTHQGGGRNSSARTVRPALIDAAKLQRPGRLNHAASQLAPFLWRVPMASGIWAISTDESADAPLPRGLYQQEKDPAAEADPANPVRYALRANLPHVHSRIVRRDGSGRQTTTDYLISAEPDGPRAVVTHHQVRAGEWAGAIGIPLSDDSKIVAAAGTAIRYMRPADADYTEREAVPRCGPDGRVMIPARETLPAGYLALGPLERAEALRQWREVIVPVAAGNPDFALVLGGSAVSPFVGYLDHADCRAFITDLAGEPNAGKSTTSRCAGAIWGAVPKDGTGVVGPWNLSAQGPGRALGMLGILPAIFDEQGVAGFGPDQWARVILAITDGSRRAADRSDGLRVSLPYSGVVISAGNASIAAGLGAGRYAGIGPKRVNTLNGPFTSSAEQAESVKPVLRDAHGHPGTVILEEFTGPKVAELVAGARKMVGLPDGIVARSAAKNMHLLVAGAAMLDEVFGTGTAIRDSAVKGALGYLAANSTDPEHDADRMMSSIRDSMASQPGRWPTVAEYIEVSKPRPEYGDNGQRDPSRTELPQHGIDRDVIGIRANDGSWFAMRAGWLAELLEPIGADKAIALAEADRRGWLSVAKSLRHKGLLTEVKPIGKAHKFMLPADDDHQDQAHEPDSGTDLPPGCPECDTTLPMHAPGCSEFDPTLWAETDADPAPAATAAGPASAPAAGVPFAPFGAEVRAYIAECAAGRLRASADGAVKMISHHGGAEAAMIRAAFTDLTTGTRSPLAAPAEPVAAPELAEVATTGAEAPAEPTAAPEAVSDGDDREAWARAARKLTDDLTDEGIESGRAIFHQVTDGVRWVSYPGQVGQAWFARLAASFPSMKPPAALVSPKVAEITEAGPLTRVNYTVKPKATIKRGRHFVTSYDLNGQHMAAAGSAELGDGEPRAIERPRDIDGLTGLPGYVKTARAIRTGHPAFGTIVAGTWVAMPLVRFLTRDLGLTVPAAEVVYWPDHGRRLSAYVGRYRDARELLMSAEPSEGTRLALAMLKSQANAFVGMFHSSTYSHGGFYRPDWYDQIVATAEANALRALAKCGAAPVAKMADSAYWIAETAPYVPDGLVISGQLGKWKLDRHGPITDEFLDALRDLAPASARDAVIKINAERLAGE